MFKRPDWMNQSGRNCHGCCGSHRSQRACRGGQRGERVFVGAEYILPALLDSDLGSSLSLAGP